VRAEPGGGFVTIGDDNTASAALVPSNDFSMSELAMSGQSLSGATDRYTLTSTIAALHPGLGALSFTLTGGGGFSPDQGAGCSVDDRTRVTCVDLVEARSVGFNVDFTSTVAHTAGIRLVTPDGYDDPDPDNNARTVTDLLPGIDLHLADLTTDNGSPSNHDDQHVVTTRLSGVRDALPEVMYTLTGDATFTQVAGAGCEVTDNRTVSCVNPKDAPVVFRVTPANPRTATAITVTANPGAPFVEVGRLDNSASASLAPRPTYDFGMGALSPAGHTVSGGSDHYTLAGSLRPVPEGVDGITLALTGGTFGRQDPGCARVDDIRLVCSGLASPRSVDLRVDSASPSAHSIGVTIELPRGYEDPDPSDNARSVAVTPGVDLAMGTLTPTDPVPADGTYRVTTELDGARTGPVTFSAAGAATFTDTSCILDSPTQVSCPRPAVPQRVMFRLTPARPSSRAAVTIRAQPASTLVELRDEDNSATTSLAPDVSLDSVRVTGHRDDNRRAMLRAHVSGVPGGVDVLRLRLSGGSVGTGASQVHLAGGASGVDGQNDVDCYTSAVDGTAVTNSAYGTCTGLASATGGRFYVDLRAAHPHGTGSVVRFTATPVGADEGPHLANNSRALTVG
jgi:hypothetical protein